QRHPPPFPARRSSDLSAARRSGGTSKPRSATKWTLRSSLSFLPVTTSIRADLTASCRRVSSSFVSAGGGVPDKPAKYASALLTRSEEHTSELQSLRHR